MIESRGKRARSRMIIMHAAKGLFEEKGIRNVTFNDIAERADMCRTTIFNHFSTINELMLALSEQEIVDLMEFCHDSKLEGKELITAMVALIGLGHIKSFADTREFVKVDRRYEPDPKNKAIYDKLFADYKEIYHSLSRAYEKANGERFESD